MVTMIMDGDDSLNRVELDFFLKGNTSLDSIEMKKPFPWISENAWKDILKLDNLNPSWTGFIENLKANGNEFKKWYDLETPEKADLPCGYSQKLSSF